MSSNVKEMFEDTKYIMRTRNS